MVGDNHGSGTRRALSQGTDKAMTDQTSTVYDPVIKMTSHSMYDEHRDEVVDWNGTLSNLFADWRNGGTDCEEQTGETEGEVKDKLRKDGVYQILGFVGVYFTLHVVQ